MCFLNNAWFEDECVQVKVAKNQECSVELRTSNSGSEIDFLNLKALRKAFAADPIDECSAQIERAF